MVADPAVAGRLGREPRQSRSRATRQALLDATIESLAEVGWAGTTVVAVAARVGVSRGAAQHHFTTRDDLVRAAVERVIDDLRVDLPRWEAELDGRDDRATAVLQRLADLWAGRLGRAALHLWVAASTSASARELLLPLERRLSHEMEHDVMALLHLDVDDPEARVRVRLVFDALRGIGLASLVRPETLPARREDLVRLAALVVNG